jgi:hypothetical protein
VVVRLSGLFPRSRVDRTSHIRNYICLC